MQAKYQLGKATMSRLLDTCERTDLAISAAMKIAVEWDAIRRGSPLPKTADRHRSKSAKLGDAPEAVIMYVPREWGDALGDGEERRDRIVGALMRWMDAGAPTDLVIRTGEHMRKRAEAAKLNADEGGMSCVKIQLGSLRQRVVDAANDARTNATALLRRILWDAFKTQFGRELPVATERPHNAFRCGARLDNAISVGLPVRWLVEIDAVRTGSRQDWMESAIFAHFGEPFACRRPVQAKPVKVFSGRSSAPRPEMVCEAREQSRWPAGCTVRIGAITGRACVVRVEGAA